MGSRRIEILSFYLPLDGLLFVALVCLCIDHNVTCIPRGRQAPPSTLRKNKDAPQRVLLFVGMTLTIFYLAFLVGAKAAFNLAIKISMPLNECSCFCWCDHNLPCIPRECQAPLVPGLHTSTYKEPRRRTAHLGCRPALPILCFICSSRWALFVSSCWHKQSNNMFMQSIRPCCTTKISGN